MATGWLALLLAVVPALSGAATELRAVTFSGAATGGTLQLRLSAPVRPRLKARAATHQWWIDLPATYRGPALRLPAASGSLQSITVQPQKGGTLRVTVTAASGATLRARGVAASTQPAFELRSVAVARTGDGARSTSAKPAPAAMSASTQAQSRVQASAATSPAAAPVVPVAAPHAPREQRRDIVVAVDAGHGGEDPGAHGPGGTQEKTVTLAIAKQLAARLSREAGVRAVLTRPDDHFVELRDRAARARKAGADLFVSIHADAVLNHDIEGASVYVLSERGASSEAARLLADRENAADLRGVPLKGRSHELASVLMDLSQSAAVGNSAEAAGNVLAALDEVGAVRKRVVQYAGFVVLKSPDMPSMLVETAYISNPGEERKLRDPAWQSRLADAIAGGVMKYLRAHPPDGTREARAPREADPVRLAQR